ncbi:MAG: translation elongation factor Ts [Ferrimicrobium sp.]
MFQVKAADVQALRKATGAGMLDAKKALEEAEGNPGRAAQILRERGIVGVAKRQDRKSSEGTVALSLNGERIGAIVELRCETDFVAKSADFVNTVNEIAAAVANDGEDAVAGFNEMIEGLQLTLKENISVGRVARVEAGPDQRVSGYLHIQVDRGVNGVLVLLEGGTSELAHDVALHVAFARPTYLSRDEIPETVIAEERRTFETITRNEGKPEAQLAKIVDGRMEGFFKEVSLLDQPFVKDDKRRVKEVVAPGRVVSFVQVVVGE